MKLGRRAATVAVAVLIVSVPAGARAFPDYLGSRSLSMGGAGRADARGGGAPLLNPAGMSLGRLYTLEGGYQYINHGGGNMIHASVVDSTSGFGLAGGAFYTYRSASTPEGGNLVGHEPGLSLSFPFADRVLLGFTGKYLRVSGGALEVDGSNKHSGFTADVGLIVRAGSLLTVGVAGYNLRDLSTVYAPVAVGYGVAVNPLPDLVIALDAVHDFTTSDPMRGVITSVGGGAEYNFQQRAVFRLGGGRDGRSQNSYLSAGLAGMSELGALDIGFRQDLSAGGASGGLKSTVLAVGLRLFVPQP